MELVFLAIPEFCRGTTFVGDSLYVYLMYALITDMLHTFCRPSNGLHTCWLADLNVFCFTPPGKRSCKPWALADGHSRRRRLRTLVPTSRTRTGTCERLFYSLCASYNMRLCRAMVREIRGSIGSQIDHQLAGGFIKEPHVRNCLRFVH